MSSTVGDITAALALLAACAYILGFLTVSLYLSELGFSDFELLRARYIFTGGLIIAFITVSCLLFVLGFWFATSFSIFVTVGAAIILFHVPVLLYIRLIAARERQEVEGTFAKVMSTPGIVRKGVTLFLATRQFFIRAYYPVITAVWTGLSVGTLWVIGRRKPLRAEHPDSFVEQFVHDNIQSWDQSLSGPDRFLWLAAGCFVFLGLLYGFLTTFARDIYPYISEAFGGGKPFGGDKESRARLQFSSAEAAKASKELGIPFTAHTLVSDPVTILHNGANTYVVQRDDGGVFRISKGTVQGLQLVDA